MYRGPEPKGERLKAFSARMSIGMLFAMISSKNFRPRVTCDCQSPT